MTKASTKRRSDGDGAIYFEHAKSCPRLTAGPPDDQGQPTKIRPAHKDCKGKWIGAVVLGYRDGKAVRRKVSANTKAGAASRMRKLREEHADGELPPAGAPMTVEQWMTHWLDGLVTSRRVRPSTWVTYDRVVHCNILPLLGHYRLDRLAPEHIEAAWGVLAIKGSPTAKNGGPLSPNSVRLTHSILARALRVAVQRDRISRNPADANSMDAPSGEQKEMQVLTVAQIQQVLAAARGDRLEARWSIALSFGLRRGEVLGLRWEDVDLDLGVIRVRQALSRVRGAGLTFGEPKSKRSKRDIAIPAPLLQILRQHRSIQLAERLSAGSVWTDSGLVFCQKNGKPIDPGQDGRAWKALLVQAGVPHVRLHDARHSAATVMLLKGVPPRVVMDLLGHSQISVTSKYQHAVDELKQVAAELVGDAIWG